MTEDLSESLRLVLERNRKLERRLKQENLISLVLLVLVFVLCGIASYLASTAPTRELAACEKENRNLYGVLDGAIHEIEDYQNEDSK